MSATRRANRNEQWIGAYVLLAARACLGRAGLKACLGMRTGGLEQR